MKQDTQLYEDIREKLEFDPAIDPDKITFSVQHGVATINGKVCSHAEKKLIKRAIRNIDGIKAVADEVVVTPIASSPNDTEIATAAVRMLELDPTLPKDKIKVSVDNRNLTLTGEVAWHYQRQNAEKDIDYLAGITKIDNQIVVKPYLSMALESEVKEKIKKEFERHALIDARNISVEIFGTTITLYGDVQSWAEFDEASQIAWSIPGVSHVENKIIIK